MAINNIKPIVIDVDELTDNGFNCYLKGRSYDLQENFKSRSPELAVLNYKKGYYQYGNKLCQYSIAISIMLGDFLEYFDEKDMKVPFPTLEEIEELAKGNTIESLYAKFVLAAYYNYGLTGIPQDENKAYEIIKKCVEQGHIGAMYDLGAKEKFVDRIGEDNSSYYLKLASDNGSLRARQLIATNKERVKK